jgi:predicted ATP-dependent endonuclease of OLD family
LSNENQPRLLSFTLDGWDVLGGKVSVSLSDRVAVLVGRNGAGKSAILEGLQAIASLAVGRDNLDWRGDAENRPKILYVEILTTTQRLLKYDYELISLVTVEDLDINESSTENDDLEENQFSWNDCCQYLDGGKELIWITEAGITKFDQNDNSNSAVLGSNNSFGRFHVLQDKLRLPTEMKWVYDVLRGIKIIGKTPVRRTLNRHPSLIGVKGKHHFSNVFELTDNLSRRMYNLIDNGEISELESICKRVGIGERITEIKFTPNDSLEGNDNQFYYSVLLDGVNIGFLSDGTIRVLSILLEIISSQPSPLKIIEEPEMQIHPGLLEKLLNEIEAYTFGENLIISTHSPQVVSWAKPGKINLIYRDDGKISVRKLSENEIYRVVEYLSEDGDLGEWIYSGILDD